MYEATGEQGYKEFVISQLSSWKNPEGSFACLPEQDYLAYFFALEQTGEEEYRNKIEAIMLSSKWTLELMPFVAKYETNYRRKEHYCEIAAMFRKNHSFTGKELVALIETIGQMSEEIYEYYRELRDLFQAVMKEKLKKLQDSSERLELGYSILRACNLGVLQTEKYMDFGELAWKMIAGNNKGRCAGLQEMFQAQHIIQTKQEV